MQQQTFNFSVIDKYELDFNQLYLIVKLYHKKRAEFQNPYSSYEQYVKYTLNPESAQWYYERNFCDFSGDFDFFLNEKLVKQSKTSYHSTYTLTDDGIQLSKNIVTDFPIFNNYYFEIETNFDKTIYKFQNGLEYWNYFKITVQNKEEHSEVKNTETYNTKPLEFDLYYSAILFLKTLHKNLQ